MKTFKFEISPYPQEFIISAETEQEAREKAEQRFYDKMNGASIYEIKKTEEEEL